MAQKAARTRQVGPGRANGSGVKHIKDLVPDPQNRRQHNPRNLGMVVDALHQVGAARSIVIDEDNVVLAGNGVTEAAAEAGITKVQVVEADGVNAGCRAADRANAGAEAGAGEAGRFLNRIGATPLAGFQLRYVYFLDASWSGRLTVPALPYSAIKAAGAGMYKGHPRERSADSGTAAPTAGGGAHPTRSLHPEAPA